MTVDWVAPQNVADDSRILVVIPGITGNSGSQYVRYIAHEAINKGYRVAVIQGRGIGGVPLKVKTT